MKKPHTSFVIFVSFSTGRSPLTTVSRRPGLFLSLRLTNNDRIFCLYAAFVPPLSLKTHFSTPRARDKISSTASERSKGGNIKAHDEQLTGRGVTRQSVINQFNAFVAGCVANSSLDSIRLRCPSILLPECRRWCCRSAHSAHRCFTICAHGMISEKVRRTI